MIANVWMSMFMKEPHPFLYTNRIGVNQCKNQKNLRAEMILDASDFKGREEWEWNIYTDSKVVLVICHLELVEGYSLYWVWIRHAHHDNF